MWFIRHQFKSCQLLLLILIFVSSEVGAAKEFITLSDDQDDYSLASYFSILEDPTNKLTIDDIQQRKYAKRFGKNQDTDLTLGYSNSTFWLRFSVKDLSTTNRIWLLQQNYADTHFMDMYQQNNNYRLQRSGSLVPLASRDIVQRNIIFSTSFPKNSEQIVYLRIKSHGTLSLDVHLLSQQAFTNKNSSNVLFLGFFYGILLIMAIYNLFFFLSLKEQSYLFLSLYIMFCAMVYALYDGFAQLILSAAILPTAWFLLPSFIGLTSIAIMLHRHAFLSIQGGISFINRFHYSLLLIWVITISLSPFISSVVTMNMTFFLALVTSCYVLSTTIISWRQNNPAARFAVLGWVIFVVCICLLSLSRLQVVPDYLIFEDFTRIGLVTLVLLLSIALVDHVNQLKMQSEQSHLGLLSSEMQRNLALEAAHLGIWRWDIGSNLVYWSDQACNIFELPNSTGPGNFDDYCKLIHPDDLALFETAIENAIEHKDIFSLQHRIVRRNGKISWLQCFGKVEFDKNNKLVGTVGTIQDISQQKQLEKENQQNHQLYEDIFSTATEGFVIRTMDGEPLQVNPAICKLYGYSREEFLTLNLKQLVHPDSLDDLAVLYRTINENKPYIRQVKRLKKDGSAIDVEIHASPIFFQGKRQIFSIVHDITDRKRTENTISDIAKGVATVTGTEFFSQLLIQMSKLFNSKYSYIGLVDKNNSDVLNSLVFCDQGTISNNISYSLAHSPCHEAFGKDTIAYPDNVGELFPLDAHIKDLDIKSYISSPLFDTAGNPMGTLVTMDSQPMKNSDHIAEIIKIFAARVGAELERVRAQDALKAYQDQLENTVDLRTSELKKVNQELESFSYSVSHDLRSPLRAIDGFSKALLDDYDGQLDAEGQDLLVRVRKNTVRMGKLIEDLLNLSRIGRTKLNIQSINLEKFSKEIMQQLQDGHGKHQAEFICTVSDTVAADEELLRIALTNLFSNALKYSANIEHAVIEFGKKVENGEAQYFIKDNGVGFDMRFADKLFGAFQRMHGRDYEGSGIGLATVQRIIHLHKGSIWATAEPNKGATFFFTIGDVSPNSA